MSPAVICAFPQYPAMVKPVIPARSATACIPSSPTRA